MILTCFGFVFYRATRLFLCHSNRYYGESSHGSSIIDAEAIYIDSRVACDPAPSLVRGKIVFVYYDIDECNLEETYIKLDQAGACGFVFIGPYSPPGMLSYMHYSWDTNKHLERIMMVSRAR